MGENRQAAAGGVAPDVDEDVDLVGADAGHDLWVGDAADRADLAGRRQGVLAGRVGAVEEDLDGLGVVGLQHRQQELGDLIAREARADIARPFRTGLGETLR